MMDTLLISVDIRKDKTIQATTTDIGNVYKNNGK